MKKQRKEANNWQRSRNHYKNAPLLLKVLHTDPNFEYNLKTDVENFERVKNDQEIINQLKERLDEFTEFENMFIKITPVSVLLDLIIDCAEEAHKESNIYEFEQLLVQMFLFLYPELHGATLASNSQKFAFVSPKHDKILAETIKLEAISQNLRQSPNELN